MLRISTALIGLILLLIIHSSTQAQTAPSVQRIELADTQLAATEQGRMDLRYLASCALAADTVLVATIEGTEYEFPGDIGLAPEWYRSPLNAEQERWVSACILARTNFFGAHVTLSLRSPFPNQAPGLIASDQEHELFSEQEAIYFGNIFLPQPVAYVCGNNDSKIRQQQLRAQQRICALPLDELSSDGRRVTACEFIYVGSCTANAFIQNGIHYQQAISVYLPPSP